MYNEEIKEKYLVDNKGHRRYLERLSDYEECLGIDIAQMSRAQALSIIQKSGGYDIGTFGTIVSSAKSYTKWCYDNGIFPDSPYGMLGISPSDINPQETIKKLIFPTEESLFDEIKKYVPLYDGYIEVVSCIFAWIGVPEPLEISESDVFIEGRKIMMGGKVIVDGFSDNIADFLTQYKNLKVATRGSATGGYYVVKDCSFDTFIKRFCTTKSSKMGKKLDIRVIQSAIYKLNEKSNNENGRDDGTIQRFNYRNILKSGSLSRLYAAEKSGLDVFDKNNKDIVESFFYEANYRSITWLYKHYKIAFNL